ncbi:hypothetical protein [Streptomyces chartreusis]|uniref:hypothetical protein n=1 Tax=Streptomyces chartreusis TaxID=1969 RepID=UPI0036BAA573
METFVTAIVVLAMIAFGALLIHMLNSQHSDRMTAFHYGRTGMPAPGPAPPAPRKTHGRVGVSGTAGRPDRRDDDSHGPSRPNQRRRPK